MRENLAFRAAAKDRDIAKYRADLHGQTRELLTKFGKIDVMWFDFSYWDVSGVGPKARAKPSGSPSG